LISKKYSYIDLPDSQLARLWSSPKGLGASLRPPGGASVEVVQSQLPKLDLQPQYTIENMSQLINILNQG
jgi:hypothetical protein